MVDRKAFIGGLLGSGIVAAASKCAAASAGEANLGPVRLRIGVFSDLHLFNEKEIPRIEKTLRKFDEWKVDGVLGGSDLTEYGLVQQLKMVADTWFRVFPNGRGGDGRPVVNLMHYGDHDMSEGYLDHPIAKELCPDDAKRRASLLFPVENRARYWEACFREPFSQITVKKVKGYTFVLAHFTHGEKDNTYGNNVPGLEKVFARLKTDPAKPFFYSQHRIPKGTVGGDDVWGQDDGKTTALFSNYPNLIAFCGHEHMNLAFEKAIWQGAFNCVQISSNSYCVTAAGRENGYAIDDSKGWYPKGAVQCMSETGAAGCTQCMLMTVYDTAVVLKRWEIREDKPIGPDWVMPIASFAQRPDEKPFAFARRARESVVPAFPQGAKVTVSAFEKRPRRDGAVVDMLTVTFPAAPAAQGRLRANDYAVALELKQFDCTRVILEKRVYSPCYMKAAETDVGPVICRFAADEIPVGWRLRFTVRPVDAWNQPGLPISSDWKVLRS